MFRRSGGKRGEYFCSSTAVVNSGDSWSSIHALPAPKNQKFESNSAIRRPDQGLRLQFTVFNVARAHIHLPIPTPASTSLISPPLCALLYQWVHPPSGQFFGSLLSQPRGKRTLQPLKLFANHHHHHQTSHRRRPSSPLPVSSLRPHFQSQQITIHNVRRLWQWQHPRQGGVATLARMEDHPRDGR